MRAALLLVLLSLPVVALSQAVKESSTMAKTRVPSITAVPDYPEKARRDRIEGDVEVCFQIDRDGRPRKISVRRSSHRLLEKPSIRAVRASRYEPLPRNVEVPAIKTCRVFEFRLKPV